VSAQLGLLEITHLYYWTPKEIPVKVYILLRYCVLALPNGPKFSFLTPDEGEDPVFDTLRFKKPQDHGQCL
jgi:hypothetical protein